MLDYEKKYWDNKINFICGTDEAGRGCCAGPLVCACVIFPKNYQNILINDSKKISNNKRNKLFNIIINDAIDYSIIFISSKEVDELNPKKASKLGMKRCIENLKIIPEIVITDYENIDIKIKQDNLIKGDQKSITVAAASILAKVSRDNYMIDLDKKYPNFMFKKHKGYCTKMHNNAIKKYGITPEHRVSYKNIKSILIK
ncbi:ribonuclease HII [Mycoplasma elephantis]|uniref:ribonuclease HII n=1 Tax=Mycoplasma elephantis TaxID=114882 RepID=UPI000483BD54|nr:ribonuclease HII [Mycoplasma elephantis]